MSFRATFPAVPQGVGAIRAELTSLARKWGLDSQQVNAVALAVSEAATNAIIHAYRGREGTIEVSADNDGSEMTVVVADDGVGLLPRTDGEGLGLGLPIIASLARRTEIVTRPQGGTEIHMVFPAAGEGGS